MKQFYLLLVAFTAISTGQSFAQTASITSPNSSTTSITAGGTVNFTGSKGGSFSGSGNNYNYAWTSVSSSGVTFNPPTRSTSSGSSSTTATFANTGTYQVSV